MGRFPIAITALVVLSVSALVGQSTDASIGGLVTDPSHAVVGGAKVTALNLSTNARYQTATRASGEFNLANLPPSTYRIEVEKDGFKRLVKPQLTLQVQDAVELNFELAVGAASETVTVEGGAPLVNTESPTVSTVIDQTFVDNLPLNGRSFQTLLMLTPGVVVTATAFDDQGQFSVNGQRADANYFTVDGVSANFGVTGYIAMVQSASGALPALTASGGTNSLVSADAMQEFRIQTSSFAPEFGRTPGAQVSIVTRSGSNEFHGSLFEYFRNDALDAKDWFVNYNGLRKPAERSNDFGGVLGGPIRKNKTFFFFSYEGLRLRQPESQESVVPDAATRQAAPAAIQPFLNAFPIANGPELGGGAAEFNAGYSNPSTLNATSLRIDQVLTSKVTLFGRYDYSPSNVDQRGPQLGGAVLSLKQLLSTSVQTATIGSNQSITPEINNEFRANYSNDRVGTVFSTDNFGGAVPLPNSLLFPPGVSPATGVFSLYISGIGEFATGPEATDEQRQVNLVDNVAVTKGSHQMKFGVDYRWLAPFSVPYAYRQFFEFSGFSATSGGLLSGIPLFAETGAAQSDSLRSRNFSLYAQDSWKATPRLTLTYGLRWDVNPALTGANLANDPFNVTGLNGPSTLALAPRGTPLYQTTWGNVAPRLGLAYQLGRRPGWGTVLRAGWGIFYDLGQGSLGGVSSYFPYNVYSILPSGTTFPLSPANAAAPPFTTNPPVGTILATVSNQKLPRSYQWNVALEQELGRDQSLSVTYIGALGRDLLRVSELQNLSPNFAFIGLTDNSATSDYHALQVKFQRRLARGLQALASYTFSHSIDNASTDAFATYLNSPVSVGSPNIDRGDSDFDIRHAFTTGFTYAIPSPAAARSVRTIFGGWSLDGFVLARSAPPVDIVEPQFQGNGIALDPRPNIVPGVPLVLYGSGYPGGKIINGAAFTPAPADTQGDLGRNVLRAFDATQADIALQRVFRIREHAGLRLRGEFFNIFNHPNFGSPNNMLTSPLFGYSMQTLANGLGTGGANGGFNPLYQIGGPRSVQLALKLTI